MYLDIFILIVALYAVWKGWSHGFLKELVSLLGFFAGLLVAALCYQYLGEYLTVTGSQVNMITSVVAFLILWIVVPMVLGVGATLITKVLNRTLIIGTLNHIGGVAVSVLKYGILLSCALNVMGSLHILNPERTVGSQLYEPVKQISLSALSTVSDKMQAEPENEKNDTVWIDVKH